jgi:ATP-dependent DNA helicase RecG
MFDRDLQEIIRAENKEFIAQALERAAAAAEQMTPEIILSPLENVPGQSGIDDLSNEALEAYRTVARLTDEVSSPSFKRRLARLGLLQLQGDRFTPTGFGLLLFGEEPRTVMPQAGLLGTIHFPDGKEEVKDFEGPQVFVPEQALQWLRDKLPNLIDRSDARRRQTDDRLFEIVREGIVNALVHRDYSIEGAKCQLVVAPDIIEIRSPGGPVEPITLQQMQSFGAPMLSRNPVLHFVFAQMEMAEERGLGLKSMKRRAEEAGLPLPRYAWADPYLVLTLYRSPEGVTRTLNPLVLAELNADERAGWEFLTGRAIVSSNELMRQLGFDEKKAQRILKKLMQVNLIRRVGKGRATRYEVILAPLPPTGGSLTLE